MLSPPPPSPPSSRAQNKEVCTDKGVKYAAPPPPAGHKTKKYVVTKVSNTLFTPHPPPSRAETKEVCTDKGVKCSFLRNYYYNSLWELFLHFIGQLYG